MPYVPPKQINAFPTSKILVAITPAGPRKLCTKGSVKFPMLKPGTQSTYKARCSALWPNVEMIAVRIMRAPHPNPMSVRRSIDICRRFPVKLEIMVAGNVIFKTILDNT